MSDDVGMLGQRGDDEAAKVQLERIEERFASRWIEIDGLPLHARISKEQAPADTPAVVLVHGLGLSSTYLLPIAAELARDYRVYAPDLPGFGRSGKPRHILDVPELGDALAAWMDAFGLGGRRCSATLSAARSSSSAWRATPIG